MTTGNSHNGSNSQHRLSDQVSANTSKPLASPPATPAHARFRAPRYRLAPRGESPLAGGADGLSELRAVNPCAQRGPAGGVRGSATTPAGTGPRLLLGAARRQPRAFTPHAGICPPPPPFRGGDAGQLFVEIPRRPPAGCHRDARQAGGEGNMTKPPVCPRCC
jgi:hypothetical protein